MSHLMKNYGRLPVSFDHGQGVWLWDKEGHKYLDALAGIAVNSVGHAHPRLVRAIADQALNSFTAPTTSTLTFRNKSLRNWLNTPALKQFSSATAAWKPMNVQSKLLVNSDMPKALKFLTSSF